MVKNLNELNRKEKILLLKALSLGHVDKDSLNDDTLVAFEYSDMFLGLMMVSSQGPPWSSTTVICIGEARKALKHFNNLHFPEDNINYSNQSNA